MKREGRRFILVVGDGVEVVRRRLVGCDVVGEDIVSGASCVRRTLLESLCAIQCGSGIGRLWSLMCYAGVNSQCAVTRERSSCATSQQLNLHQRRIEREQTHSVAIYPSPPTLLPPIASETVHAYDEVSHATYPCRRTLQPARPFLPDPGRGVQLGYRRSGLRCSVYLCSSCVSCV